MPQDGRVGLTVAGRSTRPARRDAAHRARREGRHPHPGQEQRAAAAGRAGLHARRAGALRALLPAPLRRGAGDRPDRLGQVHHASTAPSTSSTRRPSNIITVEDPVEYRLPGINQVQVNTKAGLTFAAGLRSILRCDPDIVMIGEIRDRETAQIAVESALTGHLVLATLHTNDAAGALTRLTEMGVEPFLSASAVVGRPRPAARAAPVHRLPPGGLDVARGPAPRDARGRTLPAGLRDPVADLHAPWAAPRAADTGYKGRLGVYEMLVDERGHEAPGRGRRVGGARSPPGARARACGRCARTAWSRCSRATRRSRSSRAPSA